MLDGRDDCTMNARISILAHEISSMIDRVIERLRRRPVAQDWFEISIRTLRGPLRSTNANSAAFTRLPRS
jgi:hypothetical protein